MTTCKTDISGSSKEEVVSNFKAYLTKQQNANLPPKPAIEKDPNTPVFRNNRKETADRNPALAVALSYR